MRCVAPRHAFIRSITSSSTHAYVNHPIQAPIGCHESCGHGASMALVELVMLVVLAMALPGGPPSNWTRSKHA